MPGGGGGSGVRGGGFGIWGQGRDGVRGRGSGWVRGPGARVVRAREACGSSVEGRGGRGVIRAQETIGRVPHGVSRTAAHSFSALTHVLLPYGAVRHLSCLTTSCSS